MSLDTSTKKQSLAMLSMSRWISLHVVTIMGVTQFFGITESMFGHVDIGQY